MTQHTGAATGQQEQPQQPRAVKPVKAEKNLYEPYVTPMAFWAILRHVAIALFAILARLRYRGLDNVPQSGPFIIASNHLSWTDIPLIPLHLKRKVVYMAKEEYFKSKLAWLVRFLGAFPVKRGEADRQALRAGDEQLKQGNILVIFPEGTRSRQRMMAKGHPGLGMVALRSGVPVVPVAVWGTENVLKKVGARATICFGEPLLLTPKGSKITREDINNATETVMQTIAAMLPPEYRGEYGEKEKL